MQEIVETESSFKPGGGGFSQSGFSQSGGYPSLYVNRKCGAWLNGVVWGLPWPWRYANVSFNLLCCTRFVRCKTQFFWLGQANVIPCLVGAHL